MRMDFFSGRFAGLIILVAFLAGCATGESGRPEVRHTGGGQLTLRPARIAVIVPPTGDAHVSNAYARLDAETDRLFKQGLGSRVVERSHLRAVQAEQRWQYIGPASEETTVRLGRMVGADALILYRIKIPELRERMFASEGTPLSPVTIQGKVVRVETGEEVWSYVVTVEVGQSRRQFGTGGGYDPAVWQAVDRGVDAMLGAVAEAVNCVQRQCEPATGKRR